MADRVCILMNVGSPDSPEVSDVRRYLREFLLDKRVIDYPAPIRHLLVKGIIIPARVRTSARKYSSIWTEDGSPLISITKSFADKLSDVAGMPIYYCMRYGNPDPGVVLKQVAEDNPGLQEIILFPQFPHYSMSSYETTREYFLHKYKESGLRQKLTLVPPFFDDTGYVKALSEIIEGYDSSAYDYVLFSYHGIPLRHLRKCDPTGGHCLGSSNCCSVDSPAHAMCYKHQVTATTNLVAEYIGLQPHQFGLSFQSRLGTDAWLQPFTASELRELPGRGVKKLLLVSPAFVADCLETLEELCVEGRETFTEAGGEALTVASCLNTSDAWITTAHKLLDTRHDLPVH